jgi:hypothetical protein
MLYVQYVYLTEAKRSLTIREKPNFSLERMLNKDYDSKSSVEKKIPGRDPQRAWSKNELIVK